MNISGVAPSLPNSISGPSKSEELAAARTGKRGRGEQCRIQSGLRFRASVQSPSDSVLLGRTGPLFSIIRIVIYADHEFFRGFERCLSLAHRSRWTPVRAGGLESIIRKEVKNDESQHR